MMRVQIRYATNKKIVMFCHKSAVVYQLMNGWEIVPNSYKGGAND
jgi:hypothetical protein